MMFKFSSANGYFCLIESITIWQKNLKRLKSLYIPYITAQSCYSEDVFDWIRKNLMLNINYIFMVFILFNPHVIPDNAQVCFHPASQQTWRFVDDIPSMSRWWASVLPHISGIDSGHGSMYSSLGSHPMGTKYVSCTIPDWTVWTYAHEPAINMF